MLPLFSCQNTSQEAQALKEQLAQDSSGQQERPLQLAGERTAKNAGIDTLIGRNRYQLMIKGDSLLVQKNNLSLPLPLKGKKISWPPYFLRLRKPIFGPCTNLATLFLFVVVLTANSKSCISLKKEKANSWP